MSDIFYAFIVLPIIFIGIMSFLFQSEVTEIESKQFLANCPYPISDAVATITDIDGVNVVYSVAYGNGTENTGTFFECEVDSMSGLFGANTIIKEYGATLFDTIPYGWLGFVSDSITAFFNKAYNYILVLWLLIDAPAQVTNLPFWTYLNIVMFAFVGFGAFMLVKPR